MSVATEGMVALLSKLDEDTLYALARTVTQGLKKSRTTEEALQNIIKYSADEISILRRKAVTRDILFSYLEENNVKVRLPTTKNELIDKISEIWNISRVAVPSQDNSSQIAVHTHENYSQVAEHSYENYSRVAEHSHENYSQVAEHRQENYISEKNSESNELQVKTANIEQNSITRLAEQFAKWFYAMLNENECGPEHFFDDAKLKLNMYMNDDCDTTVIEDDPEEIKNMLLKTRLQHNLYFNPNDTKDGVQGRIDPHGLVMVLTCGTLHIQNVCAGVFEQVFALARDPFHDNNWKIKNTELNLRSKSKVLESPRLCDSALTSQLLMLPAD